MLPYALVQTSRKARAISKSSIRSAFLSHGDWNMNAAKLVGLLLIIAGALALGYGGFTFTRANHDAKIGPIEFSVAEQRTVDVPIWAGVGGVVLGALLLLVGGRKP
jgi:hypothetical protein